MSEKEVEGNGWLKEDGETKGEGRVRDRNRNGKEMAKKRKGVDLKEALEESVVRALKNLK